MRSWRPEFLQVFWQPIVRPEVLEIQREESYDTPLYPHDGTPASPLADLALTINS